MDKYNYMDLGEDDLFHALRDPGTILSMGVSLVSQLAKNPQDNAGDAKEVSSIHGLGRSPGKGNGNMLQYSCLENLMGRGVWQSIELYRVGRD